MSGGDPTAGDELRALIDTARKWTRERTPVAQLRALRDSDDAVGFSRAAWRDFAQLGLASLTLDEAHGGSGLGWRALGAVVGELGRTLSPLPWLATTLGGGLIAAGASETRKRALLPAVAAGERIVTLAHDEGTRHRRYHVACRVERDAGGFVLDGDKTMVLDGHVADAFVVSARSRGDASERDGLTLLVVDAQAPGVTVERLHVVDSRNAARVRFDRVRVGESDVVGAIDRGATLLDPLLDRVTIALAAELVAIQSELFERTLAYLRTRKQFGVVLGSFQALQHRMARLWGELELGRAIVAEALDTADGSDEALLARLACVAKARASDSCIATAGESLQLHGGIGVTDELDLGLFFKRAHVAARLLGDGAYQRDRFARLNGY